MLEVGSPILNFLLLVLGISSNPAPDSVHKCPGISKTLAEKSLELNSRQGSLGSRGLIWLTHVLVPAKADPIKKERSRKRGAVGTSGTGGSKMILTLLTEVVALLVRQ